jgi:hypothetical protein
MDGKIMIMIDANLTLKVSAIHRFRRLMIAQHVDHAAPNLAASRSIGHFGGSIYHQPVLTSIKCRMKRIS